MISPAATLYDDVALIDDALEPFTSPQVAERPGLRWMQDTLRERRAHILAKIAEAERSTLTIRLRTASGSSAVPALTVAALLEGLQRALHDAGATVTWREGLTNEGRRAALTFEVGDAASSQDAWTLELHRPAGPLDAQPLTADGDDRLAFDAALEALLDDLGRHADGGVQRLVVRHGLSVELSTSPASGRPRTQTLHRGSHAVG